MTTTTHLLREILLEGKARTQFEIRQTLDAMGIKVSQPKISRLLHQIGAVKLVDEEGKTHYRLPHEAGLIHELTSTQEKSLFKQWVFDVSSNETLIIVHTTPGAASMVARIVDQHRMNLDILGTIAGDDTIFIAPKSNREIESIIKKINKLFSL